MIARLSLLTVVVVVVVTVETEIKTIIISSSSNNLVIINKNIIQAQKIENDSAGDLIYICVKNKEKQ